MIPRSRPSDVKCCTLYIIQPIGILVGDKLVFVAALSLLLLSVVLVQTKLFVVLIDQVIESSMESSVSSTNRYS